MLCVRLNHRYLFLAGIFLLVVCISTAKAQSTSLTYQGRLNDNNQLANGNYDFEFKLFDALTGGAQQGATQQRLNVVVSAGIFTVGLDFGAGSFPGADRFLEIAVRSAGGGAFTILTPRQPVTQTPYAIHSTSASVADFATNATSATSAASATTATNAVTANNALQLGGVAANQYVLTGDSRLTDARNPLPGSANYIQNTAAQQATSNFNISGNGTAGTLTGNIVSATMQYNIGSARVLYSPGSFNFFAGNGAGQLNTTGISNSFFGVNAGVFNTTGSSNAFFGFEAGRNNNAGANNSYFGKDAGRSSTSGNDNAFFGNDAGQSNTTGASNAFFGKGAGADNTTATGNSFFGALAGNSNTTGANNAFFGFEAGKDNDDAFNNSFFGYQAGTSNIIGLNNAFFGFLAGALNTGSRNCFFGSGAGQVATGAFHNAFFGGQAGGATTTGDDNTFVGLDSGLTNTTGSFNTLIGSEADVSASNLTNATAIGTKALVAQSNALVLGSINGVNGATANTNVGIGTTTPLDRLHVDGIIRVETLGAAGSTDLCRNVNEQISTCSSSLRYKNRVAPFRQGLNLVSRLRPIAFTWKEGGMRDVGFAAEEVFQVEPLLTTRNAKGEIEGVKYGQLTTVLVNAINELNQENDDLKAKLQNQQAQIVKQLAAQQAQLSVQQQEMKFLKRHLCAAYPKTGVCRKQR